MLSCTLSCTYRVRFSNYPESIQVTSLNITPATQQAKENPDTLFVQKSNSHRDIRIKSVDAADLEANTTFFQEYIGNPLLVDGHKFDIGIYTVMTSLDPLRVYIYWGDVLLRSVV